jgi:hypothetical protein
MKSVCNWIRKNKDQGVLPKKHLIISFHHGVFYSSNNFKIEPAAMGILVPGPNMAATP